MNRIFFLFFLLISTSTLLVAQTNTTFFKDERMYKSVKEKKANYKLVVTLNKEGIKNKKLIFIEKNIVLWEKFFFDNQPTGIWVYRTATGEIIRTIDYSNIYLTDTNDFIFDNLSEPNTIVNNCLVRNFSIPTLFTERLNLDDLNKVYYKLLTNNEGEIIEIKIKRGKYPELEFELYRVLNLLKNETFNFKSNEYLSVFKVRLG